MSVLFDVFNALTGTREQPAAHNMPPLCRLVFLAIANRANNDTRTYEYGVECIERDTGLNAATVRKCIAALAEHAFLLPLGWTGPRNNARRVYEVRLDGKPWEASKAKVREAPPLRRKRLAASRGDAPDSATTPGVAPDHHAVMPRANTGCRPAPTPGVDKPPDQPLSKPLRNHPNEHAHGHTREDPQGKGEVLPLFPADPTTTPVPGSATRRKGDYPGAAEQVHAAYVAAREKAGVKGRPPVLDDKRRKLVAARLKDFTPDDLCAAARGIWASDWHRENGQTSLDLALRDSAHVERFRDEDARANRPPPPERPPIPRRDPPPIAPDRLAVRLAEIQERIDAAAGRAVAHG